MKKTISLLAALLVLCGCLLGCAPIVHPSGSDPAASSPSGTGQATGSPEVPTPTPPPRLGMGNSPLNIRNEGYAVLSDNVLYYADRQNGGNIWRADPDGGNAEMLAEGSFKNLNVSGGRLFFSDWDAIYVMPTDGTQQPKSIKACADPSLLVLDDWLYYTDGDAICRMRADGTEAALLAEDAGQGSRMQVDWQIHDGSLYYLRKVEGEGCDNLFRIALDGGEPTRVSDVTIWDFFIYENYIYYVDLEQSPYGIQKMALDGTRRQEIYDGNVMLYTGADGFIYMMSKPTRDAVDGLYRIRADGGGLENVAEGHCFNVSVAGEWLFFCTNDADYRISKMKLDGSDLVFIEK